MSRTSFALATLVALVSGGFTVSSATAQTSQPTTPPPTGTTPPPADTASAPETATTGAQIEVNEQERELLREQEQMENEGRRDSRDWVVQENPTVETEPEEPALSRRNQFGIRAGLALPYVFALKYDSGPDCGGGPDETFCRHAGALLLDAELDFGITGAVELALGARLGMTKDDAALDNPLQFTVGARAYTSNSAFVKFFMAGKFLLDLTPSDVENWDSIDLGARGEFGVAIDFVRYFGVYVQGGVSLTFLRAFTAAADGSVGVQARFP